MILRLHQDEAAVLEPYVVELIGGWIAVTWQGMQSPAEWRLCELGPGRGTLIADALRLMQRVPGLIVITSYSIHYTKLYESSITVAMPRT